MRFPVVLVVLAALAAPAVAACGPVAPGDARSLADAERAFAADAAARGMRDAFLAALDDSGVIFRRFALNGRAAWLARKPVPGLLAWEPERVEVSAARDLGWTTGPWTFRASAADTVSGTGHYVSVWRRDPRGPWRLLCDLGHDHAPVPARSLELREPAPRAAAGARATARETAALLARDRTLASDAAARGYAVALAGALADDGRVGRSGAPPALGTAAARPLLDSSRTAACVPLAATVARSADLGFTRGLVLRPAGAGTDTASYVRIWRREGGGWRIALDVETP